MSHFIRQMHRWLSVAQVARQHRRLTATSDGERFLKTSPAGLAYESARHDT